MQCSKVGCQQRSSVGVTLLLSMPGRWECEEYVSSRKLEGQCEQAKWELEELRWRYGGLS